MASQEEYWTWDSRVGNFYHPEWNGRTRTLHDPWPLGPSPAVILLLHETMLTCPQEPGNIHGHLAIQGITPCPSPIRVRPLTPVPSTPRSVNPSYPGGAPQPDPQPLEGYGRPVELHTSCLPGSLPPGQRNYLHSAPYGAADSLARSMGQLSTAEPAYHSQSHIPPQRRGSTPQGTLCLLPLS